MASRNPPKRVAVLINVRAPYEEDVIRGVLRYSDQAGPWQFIGTPEMPGIEFEKVDLTQVDGVIGGFFRREWADALAAANVPAVNTVNALADIPLPRVGPDDRAVAQMAADHLLERGFPQFGFVAPGDWWYVQRRREAFAQAVREHDRPCYELAVSAHHHEPDAQSVRRWLDELPKPIGIMAPNDLTGRQVINRAAEMGLRVPDDVAVVGVNNQHWVSAMAATPLSSIELDGEKTGYRAAQVLAGLMAGESPPPPQWILPVRVVARRSTDITVTQDDLVTQAMRFIRNHCAQTIHVEDVLDEVGVSRTTLEKRMKQAVGKTPQVAIFHAQVERAKKMLVDSDATIDEISRACGFRRQSRLSVVFKRLTGMTPGQYRQQRRA